MPLMETHGSRSHLFLAEEGKVAGKQAERKRMWKGKIMSSSQAMFKVVKAYPGTRARSSGYTKLKRWQRCEPKNKDLDTTHNFIRWGLLGEHERGQDIEGQWGFSHLRYHPHVTLLPTCTGSTPLLDQKQPEIRHVSSFSLCNRCQAEDMVT